MNVQIYNTVAGVIAGAVICAVLTFVGFSTMRVAFASAPSGLNAVVVSATTTQVGPQQNITLFSANTTCASRIVRTQGVEVYLTFGDTVPTGAIASTSLTAVVGFFQAASTSVAYDSGLYGCGRMTGEALASTTITVAELQ